MLAHFMLYAFVTFFAVLMAIVLETDSQKWSKKNAFIFRLTLTATSYLHLMGKIGAVSSRPAAPCLWLLLIYDFISSSVHSLVGHCYRIYDIIFVVVVIFKETICSAWRVYQWVSVDCWLFVGFLPTATFPSAVATWFVCVVLSRAGSSIVGVLITLVLLMLLVRQMLIAVIRSTYLKSTNKVDEIIIISITVQYRERNHRNDIILQNFLRVHRRPSLFSKISG